MKHANISIFVPHAGCPCQCSFCNQHAITGGAKQPTPEDVAYTAAKAAADLGERKKEAELAFFGGSFTAISREYMISLLKPAAEAVNKYGFRGIRCSTRPDAVDAEALELLQTYGVTAVELGAQSMCDKVLALNRRGHTTAQTAEAAQRIKACGLELGLQMMTGLFGDTEERALKTAERLIALKPETMRIYPAIVLRGTYLAELYQRGEYRPQTLDEAAALCAKLVPSFEEAGVRVIRVGLHAERDVEEQKLVGPYHPAFRELVQSRMFLDRLFSELSLRGGEEYRVRVNPKTVSVALGQKRKNLEVLRDAGFSVSFMQDDSVPREQFAVE